MKNKFTYLFLQWEVYINSPWRLTFLTVNPHITGCSAGTESSLISQTYRLCAGHSQPLLFPVGSTTQNSVCSCSHHFLLFHGKRHPPLLDFFFFWYSRKFFRLRVLGPKKEKCCYCTPLQSSHCHRRGKKESMGVVNLWPCLTKKPIFNFCFNHRHKES